MDVRQRRIRIFNDFFVLSTGCDYMEWKKNCSYICISYRIPMMFFLMKINIIKHDFAEQRLDYQLINILNVHGLMLFARKVQHLFFTAFKTFVKYEIINKYVDRCYEANSLTCRL